MCPCIIVRANLSYILLFDIANMNVLKSLYEELFSMVLDWKEFLNLIRWNQIEREYKPILLACDKKNPYVNMADWRWLNKNIAWLLGELAL